MTRTYLLALRVPYYIYDSKMINLNGMEEVVGSIPTRSTKSRNNLERAGG